MSIASSSEKMGVEVSGDDSIGKLSNGNQIGDQQMTIELCSDIINQYGQLIGEYSRLDDELWFSKPDEEDDPMARTEERLESSVTPSLQCEHTVHQEQLSKLINNPVSDGGTRCVREISSSLNDSSLDQSQTSSPVSVLHRRRSHSSVREKATKHAQTDSGCSLKCDFPQGLQSTGSTVTLTEQSQSIQPESYTESSLLDGTPEPTPTKPVRMRKVSNLLRSGGGDNQANKTSILESHLGQGFQETDSWEEQTLNAKRTPKRKKQRKAVKKCTHCESTKTPQWREGPMGRATLCNACGVQYRKGKLFSEYRPLISPTFDPSLHSNIIESGSCEREEDPKPKPIPERNKPKVAVKKCMHCESTETPQWREGPMGHATLCNVCGVQYTKGRLFSEYHPLESATFNSPLHSNMEESGSWEREEDPNPMPTPKRKKQKVAVKKCMHCESTRTPQWREGPMGHATLCNACGVQYRHGRLFPEYRPLKSPTFDPALHSHLPKKVQQTRMRKNAEKSAVSEDSE